MRAEKTPTPTDSEEVFGHHAGWIDQPEEHQRLFEFVNLRLAAAGLPIFGRPEDYPYLRLGHSLMANYREKTRLLTGYLCPADQAIHDYLADVLQGLREDEQAPLLPGFSLNLERHGMARLLSLPPDRDVYESALVRSHRVQQGVCHNPRADRRTTAGVFHVAEGGFPVPADKKAVPLVTFGRLLDRALQPPAELKRLPFTSSQDDQAEALVSLLLRPVVCPAVPGGAPAKSMETRFFVPGSLVSNLDFVESIFGNAGDPFLPQNDARLDIDHWSGHTGCVILAPHLVTLTKKAMGLPARADATPRQVKDGMCWETEDELYNDGGAFKITCRDHRGVIVTLIADNYFGYCKKEVKTQLSYAANLHGLCEEEHAGGALAFPSFDLGESFKLSEYIKESDHTFAEVTARHGDRMELMPEGYGIDRVWPEVIYVPEDVEITLAEQDVHWRNAGGDQHLKLLPGTIYVLPSGYRVEMVNPRDGRRWRLMGTAPEGTFCHKPCTVSGGGKSEISKKITDAMLAGPVIVADFKRDLEQVVEIINHDYGNRFKQPDEPGKPSRPLLGSERSLGSVIKLLTPRSVYTDEFNAWLESIPQSIRDLVLTIKRYYQPDWEDDWMSRFTVDLINGRPGYQLKYRKLQVMTQYVRVGFAEDGSWRIFSLRKDFWPSAKLQREDDISASVVVPAGEFSHRDAGRPERMAYKFIHNCEFRLFQRPDEAIVRGYDKTAESDFSRSGNFFSNYEPLSREEARDLVEDVIHFDLFTPPMQAMLREFAAATDGPGYVISTAHPRLVNGKPTTNPRYLQNRPDLEAPRDGYLAELSARLHRRVPEDAEVPFAVDATLPGRRNNPPDHKAGIRPLAVFSPIHYQELPELFMDFISSLTGKSPSTTGAGSEGALTKGPFNAMPAIIDLNNALV